MENIDLGLLIAALLSIAGVVERTVQFIKTVIPYNVFAAAYQKYIDQVLAAVVGGLVAALWKVDALAAFLPGLSIQYPWLGFAFTGVLLVLPSAAFHELFELLKLWRKSMRVN